MEVLPIYTLGFADFLAEHASCGSALYVFNVLPLVLDNIAGEGCRRVSPLVKGGVERGAGVVGG